MKAELVGIPPISQTIVDDTVPAGELWIEFHPHRGAPVVMVKITDFDKVIDQVRGGLQDGAQQEVEHEAE